MKIKGEVHLKVFENGKLIDEYRVENLVVNGGKDAIARIISNNDSTKWIKQIGFGEGNSTPVSGDASLTNQYTKNVSTVSFPAVNQVKFDWTCTTLECNGMTIREFGLFCSDTTLFARRLAVSPIVKNNTISLQGSWILTF